MISCMYNEYIAQIWPKHWWSKTAVMRHPSKLFKTLIKRSARISKQISHSFVLISTAQNWNNIFFWFLAKKRIIFWSKYQLRGTKRSFYLLQHLFLLSLYQYFTFKFKIPDIMSSKLYLRPIFGWFSSILSMLVEIMHYFDHFRWPVTKFSSLKTCSEYVRSFCGKLHVKSFYRS